MKNQKHPYFYLLSKRGHQIISIKKAFEPQTMKFELFKVMSSLKAMLVLELSECMQSNNVRRDMKILKERKKNKQL